MHDVTIAPQNLKREKRCANLFESLAESSKSRVAEREAIGIPGSQARSSRSSGVGIEERHRRLRGSAGPPGRRDREVCTVLPKRIIIPVEQDECEIFSEYNGKSSSVSTVERATRAVEARVTEKVTDLSVGDDNESRSWISERFNENTSSVAIVEKATSAVEARVAEKVIDLFVEDDTKLSSWNSEGFNEKSCSFSVVEIPTSAAEARLKFSSTRAFSVVDIDIKEDTKLRSWTPERFNEKSSSFSIVEIPTSAVEGIDKVIDKSFKEDTELSSWNSEKFDEKSSSFSIVETPTSAAEAHVPEKFIDIFIKDGIELSNWTSERITEKSSSFSIVELPASPAEARVPEKVIDISINDDTELRKSLIDRCEQTILGIVEQLCAGKVPSVSYKISTIETLMEQLESLNPESVSVENNTAGCASHYEACSVFETPESMDTESIQQESEESPMDILGQRRLVDFGTERSRKKIALMMKTMEKVHGLLISGKTETRRSFFYELKGDEDASTFVKEQRQVDRIVNDLANLLECPPWEMGLVASAKGLAAGEMILRLSNDHEINFDNPGGVLIPRTISAVSSIKTRAKMAIVVEKDTVFQKLLEENCPDRLNCILITGKGYPDVTTRMLVKILAEKVDLPVYVLVDADPYGVEIMCTYKYGSIALSCQWRSLACPSIRWLGLHPSELSSITKTPTIPITDADLSKLAALQSRPYVDERLSRELKIMKKGKSEIEAIIGDSDDACPISMYLQTKIDSGNYI